MNDFLLNLFTGSDDDRPVMMFPNLLNGTVYATDSHCLITIPENELLLKYGTNEKYPNAYKIIDEFSKKELQSVKVKTTDLAIELTKARIEVDKETIKCKECNGNGTVEFEYWDKNHDKHYIDGDCPICDGEGCNEKDSMFARIRLSMIKSEDGNLKAININDLYFHPFQLYRLFMVASLKRIDEFEILHDPDNYGQVISYFGNITVLTMLMRRWY